MTSFLKSLAMVVLGVALGLGATWLAIERGYGFGAVQAGVWTAWPKSGSAEADPYAKAVMASSGEVPLGAAEGLSFLARTDESGQALDGRCDYTFRSPVPNARYWTLTPLTTHGRPLTGPDLRSGFTSAEIVRGDGGAFEIVLSRSARAGNWLPLARSGPFVLMFRLYDTQVSSTSSVIDARAMPQLVRGACA